MDSLIHKHDDLRPEEKVRQNFIAFLKSLGFPMSCLLQEKALGELPHLINRWDLPQRRIDILAYGLVNDVLKPLLLVECKADILDQKALHQVLGYNYFIDAPYIVLVSKSGYVLYNCQTQTWENAIETYATMCLQVKTI